MRLARILASCCVVVAASLWTALPAGAHAAYKDSNPADGESVSAAPSSVVAEFTEPLADGSVLEVTGPCGDRVDLGDVRMTAYEMSVSMEGTAAGKYVVWYRAHSQLDPHVTQGEFSFTATQGDTCGGPEPETEVTEEGSDPEEPVAGSAPVGDDPALAATSGSDDGPAATDDASRSDAPRFERRSSGVERRRATVPNLAQGRSTEEEETSVWEGIRLEPFLTGLLLAAIIGAAGGKIYAGIMGPRS